MLVNVTNSSPFKSPRVSNKNVIRRISWGANQNPKPQLQIISRAKNFWRLGIWIRFKEGGVKIWDGWARSGHGARQFCCVQVRPLLQQQTDHFEVFAERRQMQQRIARVSALLVVSGDDQAPNRLLFTDPGGVATKHFWVRPACPPGVGILTDPGPKFYPLPYKRSQKFSGALRAPDPPTHPGTPPLRGGGSAFGPKSKKLCLGTPWVLTFR
jgi:hypothetical protein